MSGTKSQIILARYHCENKLDFCVSIIVFSKNHHGNWINFRLFSFTSQGSVGLFRDIFSAFPVQVERVRDVWIWRSSSVTRTAWFWLRIIKYSSHLLNLHMVVQGLGEISSLDGRSDSWTTKRKSWRCNCTMSMIPNESNSRQIDCWQSS